jgi:hypothetical protein
MLALPRLPQKKRGKRKNDKQNQSLRIHDSLAGGARYQSLRLHGGLAGAL